MKTKMQEITNHLTTRRDKTFNTLNEGLNVVKRPQNSRRGHEEIRMVP